MKPGQNKAGMPPRAELISWGMAPCAGEGCSTLVNPELIALCAACRDPRRKAKTTDFRTSRVRKAPREAAAPVSVPGVASSSNRPGPTKEDRE